MFLLLRPTLFGLALAGLVAAAAVTASDALQKRFDAARTDSLESCRTFRGAYGHEHAQICNDDRFGPSTWRRFRTGVAEIENAKRHFDDHDMVAAVSALSTALQIANELDDRATLTSSALSARLVNDSLALLDFEEVRVDVSLRRVLLQQVHLRSARHPFEGERVDRLHMLSRDDTWFSHTPVGQLVIVDAMVQNDVTLRAMDHAIVDGDLERCKIEAGRSVGLFATGGLDASLCPMMESVVRTAGRLDRTRNALADVDGG